MRKFDASKVVTEFRNGVTKMSPVIGRKYTVTHSDVTAQLFVTIGTSYAEDKFSPSRDEVLLEFDGYGRKLQLCGSVLVDLLGNPLVSKIRNEIFLREMPLALQAIRYADRVLYRKRAELDEVPIYICFCSAQEEYRKVYGYGTMKDYRPTIS